MGVAYSLLVIVVIYSLDGGGCMMFNEITQTICRFVLLLLTLLLIIGVVVRFSLFTERALRFNKRAVTLLSCVFYPWKEMGYEKWIKVLAFSDCGVVYFNILMTCL